MSRCELGQGRAPIHLNKGHLMLTVQIAPDDSARARRTDPTASHAAADRSQATVAAVRADVLRILRLNGPRTGVEINNLHRIYREQNFIAWTECAPDSPRKRAGDMAREGLLVILNPDDPRGTPAIYALPKAKEGDA